MLRRGGPLASLSRGSTPRRESQMSSVLTDPTLAVNSPKGVKGYWAIMFRTVLMTIRANSIPAVNSLILQYINNPSNGVPNNTKDKVSARGNLTKELFRDKMTWVVFCKGMRFLQIRKLRINLEIVTSNDKHTLIEGRWLNLVGTSAEEFKEQEQNDDNDGE